MLGLSEKNPRCLYVLGIKNYLDYNTTAYAMIFLSRKFLSSTVQQKKENW